MATSDRQFKRAAYEQLARIGKALSSGPRLEILDTLCQGPLGVEAIARRVGQSVANTSHHLQQLRRARLVDAERRGVQVTYSLADDQVCELFGAVRRLAESRLLEVGQLTKAYLHERGELEGVDRNELADRVRRGTVTVLDVRPVDEFRAGHIPGALSVPIDELERRLAELPREIVAYCRGPYCLMSLDAVQRLRAQGLTAHRLDDGLPDWRARGFELSVGDSA